MSDSKTLYVSDLDGTLLNSSATLSEYTACTINKLVENGLQFTIATARLLSPVKKMLTNVKLTVPIILMNGVMIYDMQNDSYIKVNRLQSKAVDAVVQIIRDNEITSFMYELLDDRLITYSERFENRGIHEYISKRLSRYSPIEGFPENQFDNVIYFTLIDTHDQLQPIYDALKDNPSMKLSFYKNVYCPELWYLEIFSAESSKYDAILYMKEHYGFQRAIGFGDELNDLSMFDACDVCIAVENAKDEIKQAADFICESNNDDGVAKWLQKNII